MRTCLIYKTPSTDRLGPVGSYPCEKSQVWGTNPTELRPCGTEPSHANWKSIRLITLWFYNLAKSWIRLPKRHLHKLLSKQVLYLGVPYIWASCLHQWDTFLVFCPGIHAYMLISMIHVNHTYIQRQMQICPFCMTQDCAQNI